MAKWKLVLNNQDLRDRIEQVIHTRINDRAKDFRPCYQELTDIFFAHEALLFDRRGQVEGFKAWHSERGAYKAWKYRGAKPNLASAARGASWSFDVSQFQPLVLSGKLRDQLIGRAPGLERIERPRRLVLGTNLSVLESSGYITSHSWFEPVDEDVGGIQAEGAPRYPFHPDWDHLHAEGELDPIPRTPIRVTQQLRWSWIHRIVHHLIHP